MVTAQQISDKIKTMCKGHGILDEADSLVQGCSIIWRDLNPCAKAIAVPSIKTLQFEEICKELESSKTSVRDLGRLFGV